MQLLTNSRVGCAKACLKKHQFRYELCYRPPQSEALRIGTAYHNGLEAVGKGECGFTAIRSYYGDENAYERELVLAMLAGWIWRWEGQAVETISAEEVWTRPLINPETGQPSRTWELAGKFDRIIRWNDQPALMEFKTTSQDIIAAEGEARYWQKLRMDPQVSQYLLALADQGIRTCLYDVTRKPGIRPKQIPLTDDDGLPIVTVDATGERAMTKQGKPRKTAGDGMTAHARTETPEEYGARALAAIEADPDRYYQRREITRLNTDIDEAQADLWQWGQIIRNCQKTGAWPRNTHACDNFGGCEYFAVCANGLDITQEPGFVRVDDPHPELATQEVSV